MHSPFAIADWFVIAAYVAILFLGGWWFTPKSPDDGDDYFLADRQVPVWLAAASVLSATQSAATFLGGPDYGYQGDYSYLAASVGALIASVIVARVLLPRYYAAGVTTVYELLEQRFDKRVARAAGGMFLVGRILAGGARVYLAAIAVSMVVFADVSPDHVIIGSALIVAASFGFTFMGGLKSVIWNDLVQLVLFLGAAIAVLWWLRSSLPLTTAQILDALAHAPGGQDKLRVFDFSLDPSHPFSVAALFTGVTLLYIGNSGLDQDTSQRLLACKDKNAAAKSLYWSVLATIPVTFLFITIGQLLSLHYARPDLIGAGGRLSSTFEGVKITVFMHYILTELPPGLRGLTTVGVLAAAIATTNSALNAMSSVLIQDIYRPWRERTKQMTTRSVVVAGRWGMAVAGFATFLMAALSFYWQRYTSMPLLEFALAVMTFAYAGLLGVYFAAVATRRGTEASAFAALAVGFLTILALQPYVIDLLGLPKALRSLSFPWQLCVGTLLATITCLSRTSHRVTHVD